MGQRKVRVEREGRGGRERLKNPPQEPAQAMKSSHISQVQVRGKTLSIICTQSRMLFCKGSCVDVEARNSGVLSLSRRRWSMAQERSTHVAHQFSCVFLPPSRDNAEKELPSTSITAK